MAFSIQKIIHTHNRRKLLIVLTCAAVSIVILSVGVFALFTDRASASIMATVGDVKVQLEEDFPLHNEFGAQTTEKVFRGVSLGTKRSYVRACLFPVIEYLYIGEDPETGLSVHEWRPVTSIPVSAIRYTISEDTLQNWIYDDDNGANSGFYYYKNILRKGQRTTDFVITGISIDPAALTPETVGYRLRVNFKVTLDSSQATHDAYKQVFNITDLPDGVERLT